MWRLLSSCHCIEWRVTCEDVCLTVYTRHSSPHPAPTLGTNWTGVIHSASSSGEKAAPIHWLNNNRATNCNADGESAYAAWHQMVPICTEWWCTEANEATQTHCHNPVAPAYPIWAYYAHGRQRRCQEDPVSLPSGRLEKKLGRPRITWLSTVQQDLKQHLLMLPEAAHLAQNRPLWRMMSTYGATQS